MRCKRCGKTLTKRQTVYCSIRCNAKSMGELSVSRGGKLLDEDWRRARGRKAGAASAKAAQERQRDRVSGMTPMAAWTNGYKTARQRLQRHYTRWAMKRAQELAVQMARRAA